MKMRELVVTFVCGVCAAVLLAGVANTINGLVSPEYFRVVMGWDNVSNIHGAIIAQGICEALVAGTFLSLALTCGLTIVTRRQFTPTIAFTSIGRVLGGAAGGWVAGGALALGLCRLSPEWFAMAFYQAAGHPHSISRYAWVGGSIWGIYLGAVVSLALVLVSLKSWQDAVPTRRIA